MKKTKKKDRTDERIITSRILKEEMDRELGYHFPEISGDTNTIARRDKSYSNSIDFFVKLVQRERHRSRK